MKQFWAGMGTVKLAATPARRVRDLIRLTIADGRFTDARGRLPSEADLMTEFNASRTAVRDALAMLCAEGVVERRRGLGTTPIGAYYLLDLAISAVHDPHAPSRTMPKILGWSWMPAPGVIAARLDGVATGDQCLAIEYVMLLDGAPAGVITNYLREAEGYHLDPGNFVTDFYSLLADDGIVLGDQTSTLQPQLADDHVARMLKIEPGAPVTSFEQIIRTDDGEAFDLALGAFRGDVRITVADSRAALPL
jgi:GntR family transcriptional regulator